MAICPAIHRNSTNMAECQVETELAAAGFNQFSLLGQETATIEQNESQQTRHGYMVLGSIYWYANSALLHMLHLDKENNAKDVIDTIYVLHAQGGRN